MQLDVQIVKNFSKTLMRLPLLFVICVGWLCMAPATGVAQTDEQELDTIEAEIKKSELKYKKEPEIQQQKETPAELQVENLSDLSKLSEFSNIAVMQKRFMPKTGRFQMHAGFSSIVNDPWNTSVGISLRGSFNFSEQWGIEAQGFFMNTEQSYATKDLFSQHTIDAKTFGVLNSYLGGSITWTPIYGKITLFNQRIVPFDMYFTGGGGVTALSETTVTSTPTFSLGTGQIFALSRSVAFRWDFMWNTFAIPAGTARGQNVGGGSINNLLLSFGISLYVPEASYR